MRDPAHPGESLRDALEAEGWTVTEAAATLGCTRQTLSRLLNGRTGISPAMALALERIGWSNGSFWVTRQAQYDLAQERIRREQAVAQPPRPAGGAIPAAEITEDDARPRSPSGEPP